MWFSGGGWNVLYSRLFKQNQPKKLGESMDRVCRIPGLPVFYTGALKHEHK